MSSIGDVTAYAELIFKPLNFQKREIRLVRLGPSKLHDSTVVCRLVPSSLSSRPTFEALSWCWGDRTDALEILLEGHKWHAPRNLVEALQYLRYPDRERVLWIDALSINQAGYPEALKEKTQQIQLMKYIYSLAHTTVVWMGAPPEDMALFLLSSLVDGQTLESALMHDPEDTMGHMINILLLPWWRRVWVVQEAILANNAKLQFGHLDVPMKSLVAQFRTFDQDLDSTMLRSEVYHILSLLLQETVNVFSQLLGSFSSLPALHRQALTLAQMGRYSSSILANRAFPFYALTEVLVQCRYFQTTDDRDKVWGFLGLCTDSVSLKLDPSYEYPIHKIYMETTRKLIQCSGSLYILSQCQPERHSSLNLPSWTPDWTSSRIDDPAHEWDHGPSREDREYIHHACFGQMAQNPEAGTWTPEPCKHVPITDTDRVLPLQGLRYMWIESIYHELGPCNDIFDWWTKTKAWRDAFFASRNVGQVRITGSKVLNMFKGEKAKKEARKMEAAYSKADSRAYWDLMMQGTMPRSWRPGMYAKRLQGSEGGSREDEEEEEEDDDDDEYILAENKFGSIKHRFGEMVDGQVVIVTDHVLNECRRWGRALDKGEAYEVDFNLDELFAHLRLTTVGRRYFVCPVLALDVRPVGLGPASLQRLDEVWVLAGGSHPFALRAHGRTPLNPGTSLTGDKARYLDMRYRLVGEVYMGGTALDDSASLLMAGGVVRAASGHRDWDQCLPQRRSNTIWWPPVAHLSKKKINLNDYWWTVWLY